MPGRADAEFRAGQIIHALNDNQVVRLFAAYLIFKTAKHSRIRFLVVARQLQRLKAAGKFIDKIIEIGEQSHAPFLMQNGVN